MFGIGRLGRRLGEVQWVISAIPTAHANLTLVNYLRHHEFRGRIALIARTDEDAEMVRQAAPYRVLTPFVDAAEFAATTLHEARDEPKPVK